MLDSYSSNRKSLITFDWIIVWNSNFDSVIILLKNLTMWRHYDVIGDFCRYYLENDLE